MYSVVILLNFFLAPTIVSVSVPKIHQFPPWGLYTYFIDFVSSSSNTFGSLLPSSPTPRLLLMHHSSSAKDDGFSEIRWEFNPKFKLFLSLLYLIPQHTTIYLHVILWLLGGEFLEGKNPVYFAHQFFS